MLKGSDDRNGSQLSFTVVQARGAEQAHLGATIRPCDNERGLNLRQARIPQLNFTIPLNGQRAERSIKDDWGAAQAYPHEPQGDTRRGNVWRDK